MGREFIELFNEWAGSYDDTVSGHDPEYKDVFANYDHILEVVANKASGHVVEFGIGTGNLSRLLLQKAEKVYGIEPSAEMRKIASEKISELIVLDGDFLNFPKFEEDIHTIVSTYAFHHLTNEEKAEAIQKYAQLLPVGGKVVLADTIFESEEVRQSILVEAAKNRYFNLLNDLQTEYYTDLATIEGMLQNNGFNVRKQKLNKFVWLIDAQKVK